MDFRPFHRKNEPGLPLDSFCEEYCESRIKDAITLFKENKLTQAYLRLAEVLRKDHKSEKHKDMEKKALDIVITYVGRSFSPGILLFHSSDIIGLIVTISY